MDLKWITETAQKYIVTVLVALTFSWIGLVRELYRDYVTTPREAREERAEYKRERTEQRKQDSLRAASYVERIIILEEKVGMQEVKINNIQKQKNKLKFK